MVKRALIFFAALLAFQQGNSQNFEAESPNKKLKLSVDVGKEISWSVTLGDKVVIDKVVVGMDFLKASDVDVNSKLKKHSATTNSSIIHPAIPHKDAAIKDEYNQLTLLFKSNVQLNFRVYDDGIAYQFLDKGKKEKTVVTEDLSITFPDGTKTFFPKEDKMYSHNERLYLDTSLANLSAKDFCSLPVVFDTNGTKILFTETALHDYPGMFLKANGNTTVDAIFPKYVIKAIDKSDSPDRNQLITEEADFIARTARKMTYPWRVFIISDDDRTLVESNLTYQLSRPLAIDNTDWIKPGKVAWDWYNANNIYGVDFESGLNTNTYKYYIDFASANGIEYVILDEGWTKSTTEILEFNPDIDVNELVAYGKEKGVELILWVLWKPLDANLDEILETYESWGVKGVKVDFMQRNDQYMVSSYERIAKKCAELELLVDFHGSFKPSGLRRMYPNVINYEGVKGSENNKWSSDITSDHNVTIPFIRMAAGPMDYTPGAMVNEHVENHLIRFDRPMSVGTRAHQVAMYVVYEAPLQMLCESPSRYYEEQETVDFIVQIPTVWEETIVLHGAIGDYIAVARRNGNKWYIGAMTDKSPRELQLDLSFLKEGTFTMNVFKDGVNTNRFAEDYTLETIKVNKNSKIKMQLAAGGGWSAIISK